MNVVVRDFEKEYIFELKQITQLCGQNIIKKAFIFESLRRYYGGYKYSETRNRWRDNVYIDGINTGRKYFSVHSIASKENIVSMIKISKQSLMQEFLKALLSGFDCQNSLFQIEDELNRIFERINENVRMLGNVELKYDVSELWDIVQKSDVSGITGDSLEEKDSYELVLIYLRLLREILKINPRKQIVIFENADHYLSQKEYKSVLAYMKKIALEFDVYFILSSSLYGYPVIDDDSLEGITVFNEIEFTFPSIEQLSEFININYPLYREFNNKDIMDNLSKIVQNIGLSGTLTGTVSNVLCKIINSSFGICDKADMTASIAEISFAKS